MEEGICCICGAETENEACPDPYDLEIHGDETLCILCDECYSYRSNEI